MCTDVVIEHPLLLRHVPDWFVTQQQLRQCDDYYDDNGYIKWYDGYQKRKTQKAKIKEELSPLLGIHQDGGIGVPEEEKKETEKSLYKH